MRRTLPVLLVLLAGLLGAGAAWSWGQPGPSTAAPPSRHHTVPGTAAVTSLRGLEAPAAEPSLDGLAGARPRPGTVGTVAGPFDDRFRWTALRFTSGAVRGEVDITSDVSDVLELQVVAGFYDRQGRYLGSGRFVHHGEHAGGEVAHVPDETWRFEVVAPARTADRAVSAAVGVPVLVNE